MDDEIIPTTTSFDSSSAATFTTPSFEDLPADRTVIMDEEQEEARGDHHGGSSADDCLLKTINVTSSLSFYDTIPFTLFLYSCCGCSCPHSQELPLLLLLGCDRLAVTVTDSTRRSIVLSK